MTIADTTPEVAYSGNGVTTSFAVTFLFFGTGTAAELEVIEKDTSTGAETVKTNPTHYTVSGGSGSTGTVTAVTAPATGKQWYIRRKTDVTQETDYVSNDSFPAAQHEEVLDRIVAQVQDLRHNVENRALMRDKTGGGPVRVLDADSSGQAAIWVGSGRDTLGFTDLPLEDYVAAASGHASVAATQASNASASAAAASSDAALASGHEVAANSARNTASGYAAAAAVSAGSASDAKSATEVLENDASGHASIAATHANTASAAAVASASARNTASGYVVLADSARNTASGYAVMADSARNTASGHEVAAASARNTASGHAVTAGSAANTASAAAVLAAASASAASADEVLAAASAASASASSSAAGRAAGFTYLFDSATAAADPGNGEFRLDNATPGSATAIYIDNQDELGNVISSWLDTFDDSTNNTIKGTIILKGLQTATAFLVANVTAVADSTGYRTVTISVVTAGAGAFTNGERFAVIFSRAGDKGADGVGAGDVIGLFTAGDVGEFAYVAGADTLTSKPLSSTDVVNFDSAADARATAIVNAKSADQMLGWTAAADVRVNLLTLGDISGVAASLKTTTASEYVGFNSGVDARITAAIPWTAGELQVDGASGNAIVARAATNAGVLSEIHLNASQFVGRGSTGNVAALSLAAGLTLSGTNLTISKATAAQMRSETADVYPDAAVLKHGPGVAKSVASVTYSGSTPSLNSTHSNNITGVTDTGSGQLTITIATDYTLSDWVCVATARATGAAARTTTIGSGGQAAGSVLIETRDGSGTLADAGAVFMGGFGQLP